MLVAVVEINNNRARFRELYEEQAAIDTTVAALFANGAAPSRQQVEETERALASLRTGRWVRLMWGAYLVSACFVSLALMIAEGISLRWLAMAERGPAPTDALVCYVALGFGFFWVVVTPVISLVGPVLPESLRGVSSYRNLVRYRRLVRQYGREAQADPEASAR